ncbi:MAG: 16S rRNA (uracil(1498)-N(3))-methyltransferase [Haliangiales bacterium]
MLTDRRAQHIAEVLRAQPGAQLRVGVVRGPIGAAEVTAIGPLSDAEQPAPAALSTGPASPRQPPGPYRVALDVTLAATTAPAPSVELVLAVPRPKALPRIIQSAAALGVARIDLVNAWRVDKSYLSARKLDPAVLAHHARLGCEQGGGTWVPDVAVHPLLMPFVRDVLPDRLRAVERALIAHPRDAALIEHIVGPGERPRLALAVGPEGGWIERERETFAALGFQAVTCGAQILRVETAVSALLAQLELLARLGG